MKVTIQHRTKTGLEVSVTLAIAPEDCGPLDFTMDTLHRSIFKEGDPLTPAASLLSLIGAAAHSERISANSG